MARTDITGLLGKACEATTDDAVLELLLVAYRARPLPALSELIAIAGTRAATEHAVKGSLNDQHAVWLELAAQQRAADLEWLVANLITGRAEYSLERVLALKDGWPRDPRLASSLLALADGKRMTSRPARKFWTEAFRIIRKHEHPGLAPLLAPLLAMQPQTEFEHGLMRNLRLLEVRIGKLVPVSPSTTETEALAKLAERLDVTQHRATQKTEQQFLDEIYAAALHDDGPREVFADWLQERGDPRGEFIALQLSRFYADPNNAKLHPKEKALLANHRREWAAPFEAVLSLPNSTFERGFLYSVHVHWRKLASLPALMTHPAWATVRHFKLDSEGEAACDVWIEHMIALGAKRH